MENVTVPDVQNNLPSGDALRFATSCLVFVKYVLRRREFSDPKGGC